MGGDEIAEIAGDLFDLPGCGPAARLGVVRRRSEPRGLSAGHLTDSLAFTIADWTRKLSAESASASAADCVWRAIAIRRHYAVAYSSARH